MKLYKTFLLLFLFIAIPAIAATNDLIFSEDITVSGITLGSGTTDMTVFASSSAESFDLSSGVFTITNPGSSFNVGSTNAGVGTIVILESGAMESCTANTVPGTSSTTLPTASGVYTIRPLEATSCSSLCPSLTGTATYNAYPTCGAATCDSGYALSGSGSSATCSAQSSGGGGGGGGSYIPPSTTQDDNITTTRSFVTSSDGTKVTNEIKTTKNDSGDVEKVEVDTVIATPAEIKNDQTIKLDSSEISKIKEVKIEIKKELIEDIIGTSTNKEIKVNIKGGDATTVQKSATAKGGKFLVGPDVFDINISVGDNKIDKFVNPIKLTFNISGITDRNNLKIYYYNETTSKWEIAGDGGQVLGDNIVVGINHLTDFGIMQDKEEVAEVEENKDQLSDRDMQMLQVEDDANVVFISSTDLNTILIHNNVEKDTEKQSYGMNNYIPELKEGITGLTINNIYAVNNFIIYGTITTRKLGAGERAGVVNSYKKAFNKLPTTKKEWKDCIAIGNGRWPGETSESAELKAQEEFKTIYLRNANMENLNDNAAVTVIAYGLRPANRNMDSEKAGINIFKGIYKYNPSSALDWDIVRAISYSGATR